MSVSPRLAPEEGAENAKTPSEPAGSPSISAARRAQRRRITSVPRMLEALAFALLRRRMTRPSAVRARMSMFHHRLRPCEWHRLVGQQQVDRLDFPFRRGVTERVAWREPMLQHHAAEQQAPGIARVLYPFVREQHRADRVVERGRGLARERLGLRITRDALGESDGAVERRAETRAVLSRQAARLRQPLREALRQRAMRA